MTRVAKGILHFCVTQGDFEALAKHAEEMRAFGIERDIKSGAQCLALEPALRASQVPIAGGVHTPEDESGDAHEFTTQLAQRAVARSVRFAFGTHVQALEVEGGRVAAVRTQAGRIAADAFVISLGSYSPAMLAPLGVSIPVYPLKGYSVTLDLSPDIASAAPVVSLTDEAHKLVISRFGERLRCAGTAELTGYDTSITRTRCLAIVERLRQLFPGLAPAGEGTHWAGLRPATPTNVPVIGRAKFPNLYLNTGHGTLGWTLAAGSARALADLVGGRRPEVDFPFLDA